MKHNNKLSKYFLMPMAILYLMLCSEVALSEAIAVVIGIGDYTSSSGMRDLFADNDTNKLASALEDSGYDVHLMNADSNNNMEPTKENIERFLGINNMSNSEGPVMPQISSEDFLLFFYGGHGVSRGITATDYIVPINARRNENGLLIEDSLISVQKIFESLKNKNPGRLMFITDACRNFIEVAVRSDGDETWKLGIRGISSGPDTGTRYDPELHKTKIYSIYASAAGEFAHEWYEKESGVFSHWLASTFTSDGIKSADTEKDGCVTAEELYDYVYEKTSTSTQAKPGATTQRPQQMKENWTGKFCISKYQYAGIDPIDIPTDEPRSTPAPRNERYKVEFVTAGMPPRCPRCGPVVRIRIDGNNAFKIAYPDKSYDLQLEEGEHDYRMRISGAFPTQQGLIPYNAECEGTFRVNSDLELFTAIRRDTSGPPRPPTECELTPPEF